MGRKLLGDSAIPWKVFVYIGDDNFSISRQTLQIGCMSKKNKTEEKIDLRKLLTEI